MPGVTCVSKVGGASLAITLPSNFGDTGENAAKYSNRPAQIHVTLHAIDS